MTQATELCVGLFGTAEANAGWFRVLQQEMVPFRETTEPDCPVTCFTESLPPWLENYVSSGGIALIAAPAMENLPVRPPVDGWSVLHQFHFPEAGIEEAYAPAKALLIREHGYGHIRLNEDRIIKDGLDIGKYPLVVRRTLGKGALYLSALPLSDLLILQGNRLRRFSPFSEVKERVSSIDKAQVARVMVWMLRQAFSEIDAPYVHLWYYPGQVPSVFIFRVDVDGPAGENLSRLVQECDRARITANFFINRAKCLGMETALNGLLSHEVGSHGDIHNVYDSYEENHQNILQGRRWVHEVLSIDTPFFVAPRGLWNRALGEALEDLGVPYSSDFGIDFDGLPYHPLVGNRHLNLLQVPVHPHCAERAAIQAEEEHLPAPTPQELLRYYQHVIEYKVARNEPVILYGHPQELGRYASQILPHLFAMVRKLDLPNLRYSDFTRWWLEREKVRWSARYRPQEGKVEVQVVPSLPDLSAHILPAPVSRLVVNGIPQVPDTRTGLVHLG